MKMCRAVFLIVAMTLAAMCQPLAKAQSPSDSGAPSQSQTVAQSQTPALAPQPTAPAYSSSAPYVEPGLEYHRP
jgi:hypothetical protein